MSHESIEPTNPPKGRGSFGRRAIQLALHNHDQLTRELIGVFVFNVRNQVEDVSFFDAPIAIDVFDQRRLAMMNLVKGAGQGVLPERDIPIPSLTGLGSYVARHAVIVCDPSDEGSIPLIDTDSVTALLS
jgi:hypothetical protein